MSISMLRTQQRSNSASPGRRLAGRSGAGPAQGEVVASLCPRAGWACPSIALPSCNRAYPVLRCASPPAPANPADLKSRSRKGKAEQNRTVAVGSIQSAASGINSYHKRTLEALMLQPHGFRCRSRRNRANATKSSSNRKQAANSQRCSL